MYFSQNDYYPEKGKVVTTTSETIPEDTEKTYYADSTVINEKGKTEIVDKKSIFITLGVVVALLFALNAIDL